MIMITISIVISEFTQEDGRKKKKTKRSCVTNVTGQFGKELFRTKLSSRFSHKVCLLLSSPVLLLKFIIIVRNDHH